MAVAYSDTNQGWLFVFFVFFLWGEGVVFFCFFSMSKRIYSEMRELVLETLFLKKAGKEASTM